jgi:hypothetical protein
VILKIHAVFGVKRGEVQPEPCGHVDRLAKPLPFAMQISGKSMLLQPEIEHAGAHLKQETAGLM